MLHKMQAIEITEGALLADIAVLLQLVAMYLPIFDLLVRFLMPIVMAVLVLRRGFAVGLMSCCVACFIVAVLSGLSFLIPMLLTCAAGLFLGLCMGRRLGHLVLLLLGTTSGALAVCGLTALCSLVAGVPLSSIARQLGRAYQAGFALADFAAARLGYAEWWRRLAEPALAPLAQASLAYWWALFPAAVWLFLCPVVTFMYFTTNYCVRLLGYDVRAFPGGRLERFLAWGARQLISASRKLRVIEGR
jgi:uncharacterized protein YybS (DUF2232 family)